MSSIDVIYSAVSALACGGKTGAYLAGGAAVKGSTAYLPRGGPLLPLPGVRFALSAIPLENCGDAEKLTEMVYEAAAGECAPLTENIDLLDAARLLAGCGAGSADEVYTDLFYRCKSGVTRVFGWPEDEELSAVAAADYISESGTVIGLVAVEPRFRGEKRGFRAAGLAARALSPPVTLLCGGSLEKYYAAAGFRPTGLNFYYYKDI